MSEQTLGHSSPGPAPVTDWSTDFDHTHSDWAQNAPAIWDDLRGRCPVAHSDRFGGTWLPTRFEDVSAIAYDTTHFTSHGVVVSPVRPDSDPGLGGAPPITSDPPIHQMARRLLLPAFAPKEVAKLEATTREVCHELIDEMLANNATSGDAAVDYAQHIPVRVIAHMLGLPREDGDKLRLFIHRIMETPGIDHVLSEEDTLEYYITQAIEDHRANPRDDLIGYLLGLEFDGNPLSDEHIFGSIALIIIAGIDTTWSAIGAGLWHLAAHPDDRHRMIDEPAIFPFAIEELLRAYAPVTMARLVKEDVVVGDQQLEVGDWVLLPFPAANRDPEAFDDADKVIIDREKNRHSAFGLGIHRCLGSNLARMELSVGIEVWLERVPEFALADPEAIRWSTGQVRGPRLLPMTFPASP